MIVSLGGNKEPKHITVRFSCREPDLKDHSDFSDVILMPSLTLDDESKDLNRPYKGRHPPLLNADFIPH